MRPEKRLGLVEARLCDDGTPLRGYEIHIGQTDRFGQANPWIEIDGRPEGAASADGRVRGCYLHGLFADDRFRARMLAELGGTGRTAYEDGVEATLDALAAHLEAHLDIDRLLALAAPV